MDVFLDKWNWFFGGAATMMVLILGDFWWLFLAFLVLNVTDYLTGTMKATHLGEGCSAKGAKGIGKKVGYWVIVGISFFISVAFVELGAVVHMDLEFVTLFGYFTLATYIINEIRSIFENVAVLGVEPPPFLVKGLVVAKKFIDERGNAIFGEKHTASSEKDAENTKTEPKKEGEQ